MAAPADKDVRIFTDDEIKKPCSSAAPCPEVEEPDSTSDIFDGRRDEVILRLLLDCGLRVSELAGVELEHARPRSGARLRHGQGQPAPSGSVRRPHRPSRSTGICASGQQPPQGPHDYERLLLGQRGAISPTASAGASSSSPRTQACQASTRTPSGTRSRTDGCLRPAARNVT
jgi:integrase